MTSTITLISVTQAAQILAVHPATIRRMIGRGELPAKRVGRVWRVNPRDLEPDARPLPGTPTVPANVQATSRFAGLVRLPLARKGPPAS